MANTKKHMIDLVITETDPQIMLDPAKCKILDAKTGRQIGTVQKLDLRFEVGKPVEGRLWKYDKHPGSNNYNLNDLIEYAVVVRSISHENPMRISIENMSSFDPDAYADRLRDEGLRKVFG